MSDAVIDWFDSHCHLQEEFAGAGDDAEPGPHATRLAATIARAAEAGVSRMVCVGTGAGSSAEAVALVRAMRRPDSVASLPAGGVVRMRAADATTVATSSAKQTRGARGR